MRAAAAEDIMHQIKTPIWGIQAQDVMLFAHRLTPLIRRVAKPQTGYTPEGVLADMAAGRVATWVIGDFQAFTCTEIQDRPTGRVLWNTWLAGDGLAEWVDDWLLVQEAYARHLGCTAIEFSGRRGYARKYEQTRKFRAIRTLYRAEL